MFDLTNTLNKVKASYKNDSRRAGQFGQEALMTLSKDPEDFIVMPEWWKDTFGTLGLMFGHFVEIAGDSDTGKTSLSITTMLKAQEQGCIVVYVETEGKTSEDDLIDAGLDPKQMIFMHTKITEEMYDGLKRILDALKDDYPDAKICLVIDSYGNTISLNDSEIDMTKKSQKVGGQAKTNRTGLSQIGKAQLEQKIAVLIVNYNYDNIGSVGKTSAGGKALGFFTMLRIFSARRGWYEKTRNGVKVRAGADVVYNVQKNHYMKLIKDEEGNQKLLPKKVNIRITNDGLECTGHA